MRTIPIPSPTSRRGAILVLAALLLIVIFALTAFVVDAGYMSVTATQLQNAADAAALAGIQVLPEGKTIAIAEVQSTALANNVSGTAVSIATTDIEFGKFDVTTRTFTPNDPLVNALRVTARLKDQPYLFAPVMGFQKYTQSRSAVAMLNPRDIAFVVDLSGSMNDDTETCWATDAIDAKYDDTICNLGRDKAQALYNDLGFGSFPGKYELIGKPLGMDDTWYAFAEMTKDNGVLTSGSISAAYRILNTDSEAVRKKKGYKWIIDNQLAKLMPNAKPAPNSSNPDNYAFWEKYLDYVLIQAWVGEWDDTPPPDDGEGGGGDYEPPPPPPPYPPSGAIPLQRGFENIAHRRDFPRVLGSLADASTLGAARILLAPQAVAAIQRTPGLPRRGSYESFYVPEEKDYDSILGFNNPNGSIYPDAWSTWGWVNQVGYVTYTQFLLDWGRDRSPLLENDANVYLSGSFRTQLSAASPFCPMHNESTAGGTFSFPPSEQPMHAVRRAMIAAIEEVRAKNVGLAPGVGDRVSIITFDAADESHAPEVRLSLTENFANAKTSCTTMQALSDIGNSTATEHGLSLAREHLKPVAQGGAGRTFTTKVIVLCTDGVPNVWESDADSINTYIAGHADSDYYGPDYPWYNGALTQVAQAEVERTRTYSVGMGLGADFNFLDRMARIAETDEGGLSPRGASDPSDYESQLTNIFKKIINSRGGRLVK